MNPATEKQCPACDAVMPKSAQVCPACGTAQNVPPIARTGGAGRVLVGCAIAAAVCFVGVIVIGIIAAIAIPKFANTKQKAYVAEMKTDLRNLVTAEEAYHTEHQTYQSNVSALDGFTFSQGVTLARPIDAGSNGWKASVIREPSPMQCTISVGDRAAGDAAGPAPTCKPSTEVQQ